MSYEVVKKLSPTTSLADFRASFVAPPKCSDLADYIERAIKPIALMQSKKGLRFVTLDLFEQLKADQVIYAEIRFAPLLHTQEALTSEEVVQVVNQAVAEGINKTGVKANLILCTLRHFSKSQSMETIRLVEQFSGTHVVGFDIAADEAGFPIDNHVEAFQYAKEKGIYCTAHAGEAKGADSVWETLQHLGPSRIGHGVRSAEDENLLNYLKEHNIHLEVCPTSNIQTNVFPSMKDHVCNKLYEAGVSLSINTDGRCISDVSLIDEYTTLQETFGWEKDRFLWANLEAIKHAFISDEEKEELKKLLLQGFSVNSK